MKFGGNKRNKQDLIRETHRREQEVREALEIGDLCEHGKIKWKWWAVSWLPPRKGTVKLNCVGARDDETVFVNCWRLDAWIYRKLVGGFVMKTGRGTVQTAEAWGVLQGVRLAWEKEIKEIYVVSDSAETIEFLKEHLDRPPDQLRHTYGQLNDFLET